MMGEGPIFIFGCPRSGTSLIARILGQHPRIAVPFESHIYHYLYGWRALFGDLRDPRRLRVFVADLLRMEDMRQWNPPPSFDRTLAQIQRPSFHGVFEAVLSAWAAEVGKPRWAEKTPQHTLLWREIAAGFPDLQVIHVVRDGRDVTVSYRRAFFGPKHPLFAAYRWRRYLEEADAARATLGPGRFLDVRYEDLLRDPEQLVKRMCRFLQEDYTPEMLSSKPSGEPYPTDARNLENLSRPILRGNAGKWRSAMTTNEARIFEAVAGSMLERYGYERAVPDARLPALERLWITLLKYPLMKALALLGNRKSQRIYLQLLWIYVKWRCGLWRWLVPDDSARPRPAARKQRSEPGH